MTNINPLLLDERWKILIPEWETLASHTIEKATEILSKDLEGQEVSVVLTNDTEIQKLNKAYRHQDKPTNVLSFPADIEGELGDIILAYETIEKEAKDAHITVHDHLTHLIIHGFLHLLGYDHETQEEAERMEALEIQILADLNVANPYEEK